MLIAYRAAPFAPVFNLDSFVSVRLHVPHKALINQGVVDDGMKANTTKAGHLQAFGAIYGEVDFPNVFKLKARFCVDYASDDEQGYMHCMQLFDASALRVVATAGTRSTR